MIRIFKSSFRITQGFGARPEYYGKFGLAGHEGIDLVPLGSDWTIFSLPTRGKVVKDIDMGSKGGAYGNHLTIWYPEISEAWMYCHLSSNSVSLNQEIKPMSVIGVMGATGNTQGAHLHLNRFKVDGNGVRLNKNNGYLGGIDPLPFLNDAFPTPPPTPLPPQGGGPTMDSYSRESIIRAVFRKMIGREISDYDLKVEMEKNPFVLEDMIGRFMSDEFLKNFGFHTQKEYDEQQLISQGKDSEIASLKEALRKEYEDDTDFAEQVAAEREEHKITKEKLKVAEDKLANLPVEANLQGTYRFFGLTIKVYK